MPLPSTVTFQQSDRAAKEVVLVAPGLNNKPAAMQPLMEALNGHGYDCLSVRFRFGRPLTSEQVAEDWVSAIADAYAAARARYADGSIHSVAYSLGALATLTFLQQTPAASLNRLFLIAPPLALTRSAGLVRYLTPFRRVGLALPSLAPRSIRERSFTSLADYDAMLKLSRALHQVAVAANIRRARGSCIVSIKDELVDPAGVEHWIHRQGLDWSLRTLDKRLIGGGPRHLLLSELSMGREGWDVLTREMISHLHVESAAGP